MQTLRWTPALGDASGIVAIPDQVFADTVDAISGDAFADQPAAVEIWDMSALPTAPDQVHRDVLGWATSTTGDGQEIGRTEIVDSDGDGHADTQCTWTDADRDGQWDQKTEVHYAADGQTRTSSTTVNYDNTGTPTSSIEVGYREDGVTPAHRVESTYADDGLMVTSVATEFEEDGRTEPGRNS
jgi:hypothetical protein